MNKCKEHGGVPRCSEKDCEKNAIGRIGKCRKHGGGTRCIEPGCDISAAETSKHCKKHGGGVRCTEVGCTNAARNGKGKCSDHGGAVPCAVASCSRQARYKSDKCMAHGGGDRCSVEGCGKGADSTTGTCVTHGGGRRCPHCITWVDSQAGSLRYDGFCARCFKRVFPDDPRCKVRYNHTKELMVRDAINDRYDGFVHDRALYTGNCDCTHRRRIDHRKLIGMTLVCVETDERAHAGYDPHDEEIRYDDLYMIHSGKWIFIRFNPDEPTTCMEEKLDMLLSVLDQQIHRAEADENTELVEIIKLYY